VAAVVAEIFRRGLAGIPALEVTSSLEVEKPQP